MTATPETIIADAIKACTDEFEDPVEYYVQNEARRRWEKENPDGDAYAEDKDWARESYRIISRAVLAALKERGEMVVDRAQLQNALTMLCKHDDGGIDELDRIVNPEAYAND